MGLGSSLKHAWNAFTNQDVAQYDRPYDFGNIYTVRPDRTRMRGVNERSIVSSVYTRLANDVAGVSIRHIRLDDSERYLEDIDSGLNNCLTIEANIDQAAREFRQDVAFTLFDKGVVAIVPVDTTLDPTISGGYDIKTMRVGEIVKWKPRHVHVSVYNDATGNREELRLPKQIVAIIYNPFYAVMNEPNSTLQRLIRKLSLLDAVDEQSASGKLDLIIQLPYVIKSEAKRQQADQRRKDIEFQLKGSQYGIAYTDGTEKITQLNRPAENNLMGQIEFLTNLLYSQLGVTPAVLDGTADEKTMINYYTRTIEPVLDAIVEGLKRTFLTSTARTQMQSVAWFRDPFKFVPITDMANIVDKLARNEVASSNEFRQAFGWKPSKDPKADMLINSNMPQAVTGVGVPPTNPNAPVDPNAAPDPNAPVTSSTPSGSDTSAILSDTFKTINSSLDGVFNDLGVPLDNSG